MPSDASDKEVSTRKLPPAQWRFDAVHQTEQEVEGCCRVNCRASPAPEIRLSEAYRPINQSGDLVHVREEQPRLVITVLHVQSLWVSEAVEKQLYSYRSPSVVR